MNTHTAAVHLARCRSTARAEGIALTPAGEPLLARDLDRWQEIKNAPAPRTATQETEDRFAAARGE